MIRSLFKSSLLCLLSTLLLNCSINPATHDLDVVTMSEEKELKLGKEMHEKLLQSMPIYQDKKLQKYVEEVGKHVATNSDRAELEYHFTIIDNPDINAFALPGGYIYINRGLLAYLQNEAQLAAVLAHEIAHVSARHAVRQDAAKKGAGALSVMAVLTTGSTAVGEAADLWSGAAVSGYGRELELEADRYGAQYLYNSGYDPNAMIEVIGLLKDQERFSRYLAREEGKKAKSYHGVFASHPRNDQRLQEVIAKAGELPENEKTIRQTEYRQQTEGLIFGNNYDLKASGKPSEVNRYTHKRLGFTLIYPDDWSVENKRTEIIALSPDKQAKLRLGIDALKQPTSAANYIHDQLGISLLKKSEQLSQYKLTGQTGLVETRERNADDRIAVLLQGRRAYIFTGTVSDGAQKLDPESGEPIDYDKLFTDTIASFRPIRPSSTRARTKHSRRIHYVKANEHTTFEQLSKYTRLGKYGEQQLRLINGYYPRGEPSPGEWIKIIR